MSCVCLFSLPLVPVPADVPSGTSLSQRGFVALCEQAHFTKESLTSKEPDDDHLFAYLCKDTGRERFIAPPPCQLRTDLCSQILLGTEFLTSYLEK